MRRDIVDILFFVLVGVVIGAVFVGALTRSPSQVRQEELKDIYEGKRVVVIEGNLNTNTRRYTTCPVAYFKGVTDAVSK